MDASRLVRTNSDAAKETHRCSSISPSRSKIGLKPAYESVNLVRFHPFWRNTAIYAGSSIPEPVGCIPEGRPRIPGTYCMFVSERASDSEMELNRVSSIANFLDQR